MHAIYLRCVSVILKSDIRNWLTVQDFNRSQEYFSSETQPTLWHALPTLEELQTAWEKKHDAPKYVLYKDTLTDGLDKLRKYYSQLDEKPSFVLVLGKICSTMINGIFTSPFAVLHPCYKLMYIEVLWGGPEEQAADIAEGNLDAKDWQDEARQIVERTVSHSFTYMRFQS